MSTRANIAIKHKDNTLTSIYSHWDGYPQHVGKLLLEHYNNDEAVEALIALGDVSSLGESIHKPEGHTFESPVDGHTIFYGRDRGETGTEPKKFKNLTEFMRSAAGSWAEYVYVFENGKWFYTDLYDVDKHSETFPNPKPLTAEVVKEKN